MAVSTKRPHSSTSASLLLLPVSHFQLRPFPEAASHCSKRRLNRGEGFIKRVVIPPLNSCNNLISLLLSKNSSTCSTISRGCPVAVAIEALSLLPSLTI